MKNSQYKVLVELARFKFLTSSQLVTLGVMSQVRNLNRELRLMKTADVPLIGCCTFGVHTRFGKLSSFYYLSSAGKRFLIDEMGLDADEVKAPVGKVDFGQIYFHHKYCLDIEIAAYRWLAASKGDLMVSYRYFDRLPVKGGSRSLTSFELSSGKFVRPDIVLFLEKPNNQRLLLLVELHRGKEVNRLVKQLVQHAFLLQEGVPGHTFHQSHNHSKGHRILVVLEDISILKAVFHSLKSAIGEQAEAYAPFFLFQSLEGVFQSFADGWCMLGSDELISL